MQSAESYHDVTLPAYRSHKIVRAAKITHVESADYGNIVRLTFTLPNGNRDYVEKPKTWGDRHKPAPGGYYVVYADGYESWSPAEAFEAGYTPTMADEPSDGEAAALTPHDVERAIVAEQFHVFDDTTLTVCCLKLYNGFTVTGESACVNPADYDPIVGRRIAREDAVSKVWMVLGFRERERVHQGEATTAPA